MLIGNRENLCRFCKIKIGNNFKRENKERGIYWILNNSSCCLIFYLVKKYVMFLI